MYGKPHLDYNAHVHAAKRTCADMQAVADDETLSDLCRLLARQTRDLAESLLNAIKESTNG